MVAPHRRFPAPWIARGRGLGGGEHLGPIPADLLDSAMPEPHRRFPPPWTAERIPGGYVVRDANGQSIAYVCAPAEEAEAAQATVLIMDETPGSRATLLGYPIGSGRGGWCMTKASPIMSRMLGGGS
jgi:hypothetical protein